MRLLLCRGLGEPNVLLTVRGRRSGEPRTTPVAMFELGDRRFVEASFGEVDWVRNLRASREAVIRRGRWSQAVQELARGLWWQLNGPDDTVTVVSSSTRVTAPDG